jgi:alanine racemase
VLHRERTALALEDAAARLGLREGEVAVHIKVDTGLGRYGCLPHEFLPLAEAIRKLRHLRIEGLMTHFADADNPDLSFARRQLAIFNDVRAQAAAHGIEFELVHAANSAAALSLPEARFDMVRCGIVLSGHAPAPHLRGLVELTPVLTLRSQLGRVYEAPGGATVGYGRTWTAGSPSLIGLVPLGYADGYRRSLSNRAEALVRGRRVPVVGRVSMDQIGLDLTGVPDAQEGDEVLLVGVQGQEAVTVDDLAEWAGTISYEVLCGLSGRVPRCYVHSGEPVEVCNLLGCSPTRDRPMPRKELSL